MLTIFYYLYKLVKKFGCEGFRHNLCIISINICTMLINYIIRHNFQRIFLFIVL